jgi:hypothetical protein
VRLFLNSNPGDCKRFWLESVVRFRGGGCMRTKTVEGSFLKRALAQNSFSALDERIGDWALVENGKRIRREP